MTKAEIAEALAELSRYLQMKGENRFKVAAWARAADAIETTDEDLGELVRRDRLTSIEGIGKGTAAVIRELVETGRSNYLEELREEFPPGLLDVADVPGVRSDKVAVMYADLGIESIEDLEVALAEGKLAAIPGFGPKTIERIRKGLETWELSRSQILLPMALELAESFARRLRTIRSVSAVEIAGEVRRRAETVNRLDLVVASKEPHETVRSILAADLPGHLETSGEREMSGTLRPAVPVRIQVVEKREMPSRLLFATGSTEFLSALEEIASERGTDLEPSQVRLGGRIRRPAKEEQIFELLDLPFIPPELREKGGDLRSLDPTVLVPIDGLRGAFHVHTTWSDGKASLEEMVSAAGSRKMEYVGISDHSKAASYAGGLDETRVRQQHAEIAKLQKVSKIRIFRGTECDILPDGRMDYDDETLRTFDFVIASVHSRFTMPIDEMTDRIIRAMGNPWVTFLGHLTGRKLLIREGYSVELDRVFDAAAASGVIIEINGNPRRQDLDWTVMRRALDRGVTFSINPDAHSTAALDHLVTGVWNARRGGVPAESVFNTRPLEEVEEYLEERRKSAASRPSSRAKDL
jgi:DNA polymerase (family X)